MQKNVHLKKNSTIPSNGSVLLLDFRKKRTYISYGSPQIMLKRTALPSRLTPQALITTSPAVRNTKPLKSIQKFQILIFSNSKMLVLPNLYTTYFYLSANTNMALIYKYVVYQK